MTENRDFKGVWIPKEVWLDTNFNIHEKFYLAVYQQNNRKEKIADMYMQEIVSQSTLSKVKKSLCGKGLIDVITTPMEAKETVLLNKNHGLVCEWCGCRTSAIQKHHYPIPKRKGGKETVNICPNCHYEYHQIIKGE